MTNKTLRIATRHSLLALWQAQYVKTCLQAQHPNLSIELIKITTRGDKDQTRALSDIGGKSLFVKELEQALLDDRADMAVHSLKDMSVHDHPALMLGAILKRDNPDDVFCSNQCRHIHELHAGSVIGTSSPRRQALIKHLYPQLKTTLLRGNIDSRLHKLDHGDYDAIILAAAGLIRLDLTARIQSHLDHAVFTPAIGQGAMVIECLNTRDDILSLIAPLHDHQTAICVRAERAVNKKLNGNCFTPLGAYATLTQNQLNLNAVVASLDGKHIIRSHRQGAASAPETVGLDVANDLIAQGALAILQRN